MAKKRMFTLSVVDSDAFLDLPLSTQALYFHLNMRADDDGFLGNPKRVKRLVGASDDDMKLLIAKRFLLPFEDGVMVIKHWRMHNTIQRDRYTPTVYQDEMQMLKVKDNKSYTFDGVETKCLQNVNTDIGIDIDIELDKDIDKDIDIVKDIVEYLNSTTNQKYRYQTKNTQKHIKARLSEGYTLDDFKTVIDKKTTEWQGTQMEQYLRPDTLFGAKFESYLNQNIINEPKGRVNNTVIDWSKV